MTGLSNGITWKATTIKCAKLTKAIAHRSPRAWPRTPFRFWGRIWWPLPVFGASIIPMTQVQSTRNSWKKLVIQLKLNNPLSFWGTSMDMLGTMPGYGRVWLADMVMLTLMMTEDSYCNCAATTHCASWTLFSSTDVHKYTWCIGMHSGRGGGVTSVQSSCSFICCSGMWRKRLGVEL